VFSEFVIDITERITLLIGDHTVIIDDNAVRSTKIACGLDFVNRVTELPVLNAEPIAEVFIALGSLDLLDVAGAALGHAVVEKVIDRAQQDGAR
jgi:hypothetical protein